jgi:hypothetical protein
VPLFSGGGGELSAYSEHQSQPAGQGSPGHWPLSSWHSGYLRDIFGQFLNAIELDVEACLAMKEAYEGFFGKAEKHLTNVGDGLPTASGGFLATRLELL